jgi:hypothetical protein
MHEQRQNEELITLTEAARHTPGRPSVNCIWRWCRKGVLSRCGRRVRLGHIRIGGKIFTSGVWLREFGLELAAADVEHFQRDYSDGGRQRHPPSPTQQKRLEQIEDARQSLAASGI